MDLEKIPSFEVEDIISIENVGIVVLARRLDQIDFELNEKSTLGGVPVISGDIPRKLSESGEPNFSVWGFFLKNEKDKDKFQKGRKVHLTHSND